MSATGIVVFADEEEFGADELPRGQRWGKPCPRGHGLREGRTARRAGKSGACIKCEAERQADRARERAAARARKQPNDDSRGVVNPHERTNVVCARGPECRKKNGRGNPGRLTRIAVAHGERFCSRECCGYLTEFERFGHNGEPDDVSDSALQEIES